MANMRVVAVDADRHGNISYKDLSAKVSSTNFLNYNFLKK